MSLTSIARRHAAKVLVALSKEEPPTTEIEAKAVSGEVEVTVRIAPVRYAPISELDATIRDLRARGFHVSPLTSPPPIPQTSSTVVLDENDRAVLAVLDSSTKSRKAIAIAAGFSPKSSLVRTSLAKLVKEKLAFNDRGRGYRLP